METQPKIYAMHFCSDTHSRQLIISASTKGLKLPNKYQFVCYIFHL